MIGSNAPREDQERPGGEMPQPSGQHSPVSVGLHHELHTDQVIEQ